MLTLLMRVTIISYRQVHLGIRGGINSSRLKTSDEFATGSFRITYPHYSMEQDCN